MQLTIDVGELIAGAKAHARDFHFAEAVSLLRMALDADPENPEALFEWGLVQQSLGYSHVAEDAYRKLLAIRPNATAVWNNLGNILRSQGYGAEGFDAYKHALTIKPDDAVVYSNALMSRQYLPGLTAAQNGVGHRAWNERIAAGITPLPPRTIPPLEGRQLR